MNKLVTSAIVGLVAVSPCMTAEATVVSAGSGFWAVDPDTDTGSATWRFSDPTAADTITWSSGINHTDGVAHAQNVFGPEPKFATVPVLAGRVYAGFNDNDGPGPLNSTTKTSGSGNGALVPGTLWGTNAVSTWTITATGARAGAGGGGMGFPSWDSTAEAKDPFSIFQSQLDDLDVTGSHYNQFFAVGLTGGHIPLSSTGEFLGAMGLHASYEDASGVLDILNILIDASGVTVTGSEDAKFYRLSSLAEGPTEVASSLLSLAEIKDLLTTDVESDFAIDAPLYLGIVLEDLLVPTTTLSSGALAHIHIGSMAYDADVGVSEPSAWLTMISGLFGLMFARRRSLAR